MLDQTKVAFIGSGAMGGAMISGLLEQRLVAAADITAADPHAERCAELSVRYKVQSTTDNRAAVKGANIVVLSVKPQVLPQVQQELAGQLGTSALVVSIIAGARLAGIAGEQQGIFVVGHAGPAGRGAGEILRQRAQKLLGRGQTRRQQILLVKD